MCIAHRFFFCCVLLPSIGLVLDGVHCHTQASAHIYCLIEQHLCGLQV